MCRRGKVVAASFLLGLLLSLSAAAQVRLVVDETGRRVSLPPHIERIVSLAPNLTEMVYALGADARLVGVTDWCNYPPAAKSKTSVGQVINPSLEQIVALKPQLVLATTAGNRRETVTALERLGISVYAFNPRSVEDVLASLQTLADVLGISEVGAELTARLRERLEAVAMRVRGRPRPRVLFVLWLEPLMSIGRQTFVHDALVRAGSESVTAERLEDWPRLNLEGVLGQDPDFLVLAHSPAVERQLAGLRANPVWGELRALREDRAVWLEEAVLRPGPRIVDAIEQLARILHPEAFTSP